MSEIKDIPKHWEIKKLGEVCEITSSRRIFQEEYVSSGIPFYRTKEVKELSENKELSVELFISNEKYNEIKSKNDVPKIGDILISAVGTIGISYIIKDEKSFYFKDGNLIWLKNLNCIKSKYLNFYLMHFIRFKQEIITSGSAYNALTIVKLKAFELPLPPLSEQQAIVAKIEELLSELDNGKQQLLTAQQQLKVYRQSLLKWAFEGKLTKTWRESKSNLPTANDLLLQIERGKEIFYQNQINEWELNLRRWVDNGQVGKKPSKPKALTCPDKPNVQQNEKKWNIPENWIWSQIGTLCFVTKLAGFEYTDYVKYDDKGDLPVLKAENVGLLGFKETVFSKVKTESIEMLTRSQLLGGELIIVFVGAGTGNVAMVPFNHKYFLGPNIGMARPYFNINSKYLELFYQSTFGKNLMLSAVKAVAQPSLSMGTIRQTPIAFPSIEEQAKIVEELESKLTVCDKIEETISQSLQQAETLRQSILKKAFEGRLV